MKLRLFIPERLGSSTRSDTGRVTAAVEEEAGKECRDFLRRKEIYLHCHMFTSVKIIKGSTRILPF
jgi:hypothetical protein